MTLLLALLAGGVFQLRAQSFDDYSIDAPHPRLLLTERRVRLLNRERERASMRWLQFEALINGGARFPEPGFAHALYHVAGSGDGHCAEASAAVAGGKQDLRQAALVFDWCYDALPDPARSMLLDRLGEALRQRPAQPGIAQVRSHLLAAVAANNHLETSPERELAWVIEEWWRGQMAPALEEGQRPERSEIYPLLEILHVVRENLRIDLRRDVKSYFVELPTYLLLTYYPAIYPAAENDYHIPAMPGGGEPDLRQAALSRAADLALVALDPNSQPASFLQGWSIQDAFVMRGPFGAPYEFLWANPYQPGLAFFSAPTVYYDGNSGTLALRSGWDGDADWFYFENGEMQTFADGRIQVLAPEEVGSPRRLGDSVVQFLGTTKQFSVNATDPTTYYLLGLEPETSYDVEVDDEELFEACTDRAGILVLEFPADRQAGVRLRPSPTL